MYTPTQNYGLAMPDYGDEADIGVINNMVTRKVDELLFQNRAISAPPFETTEAYTEGDLVVYENVLYRFTADKAAGAWDSSKVVQTSLAAEIEDRGSGASALSDLTDTDIDTPTDGEVLTYDGEKWVNAEGTPTVTKTATGNPIEITDGADAPLVKCVTQITGSQDLHGYDKPWVGGSGKNKLPMTVDGIKSVNTSGTWSGNSYTLNGVTFTIVTDDDGNVLGVNVSGTNTGSATIIFYLHETSEFVLPAGTYIYSSGVTSVSGNIRLRFSDGGFFAVTTSEVTRTMTESHEVMSSIVIEPNDTTTGILFAPMIRKSTDANGFAPYSNICPITAYTEGEIEVRDGDGNTTTHTTTFPSAIFRGSEDVVNGTETHDIVKVVFDGTESWAVSGTSKFYLDYAVVDIKEDSVVITNEYPYSGDVKNGGSSFVVIDHSVYIQSGSSKRIWVYDTSFSTVSDFTTWLSNHSLEVAYELATPTTTSVTPTNLPIKSLAGYSHIESSTGEMEVEYITEGYQPLVDLIQSSQHTYATTEQVVGKWVDGNDLYEVTLTNIQLSAQNTTVDLSAYNIDTIVNYEGYVESSDHSVNRAFPYYNNSDYYANVYYVKADDELHIVSVGYSDYPYVTVTIFYTKKSTATTRTLAKGATEGLRAEISGVKGETEELTTTDEKAVKTAQSEDTETKENADETEENADEMQDETVTE